MHGCCNDSLLPLALEIAAGGGEVIHDKPVRHEALRMSRRIPGRNLIAVYLDFGKLVLGIALGIDESRVDEQ